MSKVPWQNDNSSSPGSFLPKDYIQGKQDLRFVAITVSLFIIVMLGVVGAFLVTNQRWTSVRDQQTMIAAEYESESAKLDQLKLLETQREEMLSKARITTTLLETAPRSVLLAELVTSLPKEATLLQVQLDSKRIKQSPVNAASRDAKKAKAKTGSRSKSNKGKEMPPPVVLPPKFEYTLTITGVAPTNTQVADYLNRLQNSPLLEKVELAFIQQTNLEDLDLRRFEIVARLPDDADAREVNDTEEFDLDLASIPGREYNQ